MKELSIEEKAKRYDEAIEKFDVILNLNTVKESGTIFADDIRKILPELEGLDDEKIRKEMIEIFKKEAHDFPSSVIASKSNYWIAWLEKQGKKGTKGNEREIPFIEPPLTIKHAKEVMGIKQDDAWSEEDDVKINRIVACLENLNVADNDILLKDVAWLKSLKDRVQPQQQEWSEKDERMFYRCIKTIKSAYYLDGEALYWLENRLKSLRPRLQWKPSEEQIKVCKEVYADILSAKGFDLGTVNGELNRLEEELKKLREE